MSDTPQPQLIRSASARAGGKPIEVPIEVLIDGELVQRTLRYRRGLGAPAVEAIGRLAAHPRPPADAPDEVRGAWAVETLQALAAFHQDLAIDDDTRDLLTLGVDTGEFDLPFLMSVQRVIMVEASGNRPTGGSSASADGSPTTGQTTSESSPPAVDAMSPGSL